MMTWNVTADDLQVVVGGRSLAIVVEQVLGIAVIALVEKAAGSSDPWQTVVMIDADWSAAAVQSGEGGWMGWVARLIDKVNAYILTRVGNQPVAAGCPADMQSLQAWLRTHLRFMATATGAELTQR